jgi:hypothetical protein
VEECHKSSVTAYGRRGAVSDADGPLRSPSPSEPPERAQRGWGSLSAALMEELKRFTGEVWEQEDDITLLALECSAARS